MEISTDKQQLLSNLRSGDAYIVSGQAGTGKTVTGLLCGNQLLTDLKQQQRVLYLTYSKLARRQITDSLNRLKNEQLIDSEQCHRFHILNYHALWWDLITKNHAFLGISNVPLISTSNEISARTETILRDLTDRSVIPSLFQKRNGEYNQKEWLKLKRVVGGPALLYSRWGAQNFGRESQQFNGEDRFLAWAASVIMQWNREGLFTHAETICWAFDLLTKHPNVLNLTKLLYPIIIVDEFQDTDIAQMEMLKLLLPSTLIIFADPAQTIHAWRGSDANRIEELRRYCIESGRFNHVQIFELIEKHRTTRNMSDQQAINWLSIKHPKDPGHIAVRKMTFNTLSACKNLIRKQSKNSNEKTIAVLCKTNDIADQIGNYLRQTQEFKKGGKLYNINCARLGAENSPLEKGREILINLLELASAPNALQLVQDYLANEALARILPNTLPVCTPKSRDANAERWNGAGEIADALLRHFGNGLLLFPKYVITHSRRFRLPCSMDNLAISTIRYVGRSIQKQGVIGWTKLTSAEKRVSIDNALLRYENIILNTRTDLVSVMTVHQSKGREFNIVIIPWFSKIDWPESYHSAWDTRDVEVINVFHTACTRAKDDVYVLHPEGYEAEWPPI